MFWMRFIKLLTPLSSPKQCWCRHGCFPRPSPPTLGWGGRVEHIPPHVDIIKVIVILLTIYVQYCSYKIFISLLTFWGSCGVCLHNLSVNSFTLVISNFDVYCFSCLLDFIECSKLTFDVSQCIIILWRACKTKTFRF